MKKKRESYKVLAWLILIVVFLWGINLCVGIFAYEPRQDDGRGTMGDMFGAVNALFAGLAFAGLIFTIYLQRKDLDIQREALRTQLEEMRLQSEEAKRTADQLESQQQLMDFQFAQGVVNNLIEAKAKAIEGKQYTYHKENITYHGKMALNELHKSIVKGEWGQNPSFPSLENIFTLFFYTLKYIDGLSLSEERKKLLADLVNLQTGDNEIFIIYETYKNAQHELILLKRMGFHARYERILKYNKEL